MASITYDSELMTNYVSAVPVPPSSSFVTCLDHLQRPMVFCLSDDEIPLFQVIKEDASHKRSLYNVGKMMDIPSDMVIQAFDVQQGPDLTLYIVVAARYNFTQSTLFVVQPLPMRPGLFTDGQTSLRWLDQLDSKPVGTVDFIRLTPVSEKAVYPMVFVMHQPLDRISKGTDITRVAIDPSSNRWMQMKDMELPQNALSVMSIAPATHPIWGHGIYVLYEIQQRKKIVGIYTRPDPDSEEGRYLDYTFELACPEGITSIATYVDNLQSSLLLASCSEGLMLYSNEESVARNSLGKIVSCNDILKQANKLVVAQREQQLSIWVKTPGLELGYLSTSIEACGSGTPTLLLPAGKSSYFSPSIQFTKNTPVEPTTSSSSNIHWQSLVASDENGELTLVEQASDTGIWRQSPFNVANATKVFPVSSYTIYIKVTDGESQLITNARLTLRSSSSILALANGKQVVVQPSGTLLNADATGELTLIVARDSISMTTLEIMQILDAENHNLPLAGSFTIDPSAKIMQKIGEKLKTTDLSNAKTQSGKSLFEGLKASDRPSEADLKNASRCLSQMQVAASELGGTDLSTAVNASTTVSEGRKGIVDALWEAWYWVEQKVREAVDWVVKKVGDVWCFVCEIAGQIKQFVLDTVEKVGMAMSWVFEKVKLGWETLRDWVGFLFVWGDIITTKNTFSQFLTVSIEYAADKVTSAVPSIDNFFNKLVTSIEQLPKSPPPEAQPEAAGSEESKVTSSSAFNWASYQMKHGGMESGGITLKEEPALPTNADETQKLMKQKFDSAWKTIQDTISKLGEFIKQLFREKDKLSNADIMGKMGGDLLIGALNTIKDLVNGIVLSLALLLRKLSEWGNAKISVPFFSAWYKTIADHDLTLFDLVALLVAIPATVLSKVITGRAPPTFDTIDKTLLRRLLDDDPKLDDKTKSDFEMIKYSMGVGVSTILLTFNSFKLIWKSVRGGALSAAKTFKSGKVMEILSITLDIFGTISALPIGKKGNVPARELRSLVAGLTFGRLGLNTVALLTGLDSNEIVEKTLLVTDVTVALVNFSLYQVIYIAELMATKEDFTDKDDAKTAVSVLECTLQTVAGIGYFTAFFFKEKQPHITGTGVVVLQAATIGFTVAKSVQLRLEHNKNAKLVKDVV